MGRLAGGRFLMLATRMRMAAGAERDPFFASVKLLCGFEGSDASTTIVDESPVGRTLTAVGDAQIDTAQFKFGASSILFDGTGDWFTAPDSADWHLDTGDFTIELFLRWNSYSSDQEILGQYDGAGNRWTFRKNNTAGLEFFAQSAGSFTVAAFNEGSAAGMSAGNWYHIALVRNGTAFAIYRDGTAVATTTSSGAIPNLSSTLFVGGAGGAVGPLNGWLDEVRITKGVARYTGNFTPPDRAFPRR